MRAFIAITLPEHVRDHIRRMQDRLKMTGADVKWVMPGNAHLTLKFLGEIDDQTAGAVKNAIEAACKGTRAYSMTLAGTGGFPNAASPRVIWIGIADGAAQTAELSSRLETNLSPLGMAEDRPFAAHITIGRTRSSRNRKELADGIQKNAQHAPSPGAFTVNHVTLYKSTLSPKGPTYTPLFEAPLE